LTDRTEASGVARLVRYDSGAVLNLSTPISHLKPWYEVVVVGSGYGGAVAACRMAHKAGVTAGRAASVCVLERGVERRVGQYPSSLLEAVGALQIRHRLGRFGRRASLFDLHVNPDVSVLVGSGLGGTSQINASVMLRPAADVFDHRWPRELRNGNALTRYWDAAERMLAVNRQPADTPLLKVTRLLDASGAAGPAGEQCSPPIAVSFETAVNAFGIQRKRCVLCGDCVTGCNHAAKNTVTANYLPAAVAAGAEVFCSVEVDSLEPTAGRDWILHVRIRDHAWNRSGAPRMAIRAGQVFLAAGTLGTTEILLRSRARFGLPLSQKVGQRFTGNGDVLAFGYNAKERVGGVGYGRHVPADAAVGPTIAGMLDERRTQGMLIQEGAIPGVLGPLLRFAAPIMARATHVLGDTESDLRLRPIWRELDSMIRGVRHGALARTQTFLVMTQDDGRGRLLLKNKQLRVSWPKAGHQAVFARVSRRLAQLTRAMKGRYVINPFWSRLFGRRLITVHPLGGCVMGDTATTGVVDHLGRVFTGQTATKAYETLRVCDGAMVAAPLGVNPALTITALAERVAAEAPARTSTVAPPASPRVDTSTMGLRYAERLRGWVQVQRQTSRLELVLHISAESVEQLLKNPAHEARIVGVARAHTLSATPRFTITESTLNVFQNDPRHVDTKLLTYRLKLTSPSTGTTYWLHGHKKLNLEECRRGTWRAVTRLPFVVLDREIALEGGIVHDISTVIDRYGGRPLPTAPVDGLHGAALIGSGVVRAGVLDVARLVSSVEVTHAATRRQRLRVKARYAAYFLDTVIQARAWPFRRAVEVNPLDRPAAARAEDQVEQKFPDPGRTGPPRFLLTRVTRKPQTQRTPVILAPGFGMSSDAFFVGTPSLIDELDQHGYESWLLDYRASDRLDASLTQFDLDDLVHDFRDAFQMVCEETNQRVHVVAHCVASLATMMTLLKGDHLGRPLDSCVRSVVLSQSFPFVRQPLVNIIKAHLRLPELLQYLRFPEVLTPDFDVRSSFLGRVLDRLLHFYPSRERCTSGVCRRLLLLYGEVIKHDQLDRDTHDRLYDLFDRANLRMFQHLARIVRHGRLVNRRGEDVYLTAEGARRLTVPITLLQGVANNLFRPSGAQLTHQWLLRTVKSPEAEERFRVVYLPRLGHLDVFIGKDAMHQTFPAILNALEAARTRTT
jgi:cholesterol oxidase